MKDWVKWLLLGALSVLFGIVSLGNAVLATLAVTTLTGALLLASGGFQIIGAFAPGETTGSKIFGLLMGLLMGFLGVSFLFNPLEGAISLTMLVLIMLAAGGVVRIYFSWQMRETRFFWPMLLSGGISILLAAYIYANFAAASLSFLGIMLGVELLMNGVSLMAMALTLRHHNRS